LTYISWYSDFDKFLINVKFLDLALLLAVFLRMFKTISARPTKLGS